MPQHPATPERILDVAQEMLQQRGYHAFSFRDIAERVGIRTASIHYHFRSKDNLAEALLDRIRRRFAAALDGITQEVSEPAGRLHRFAALFLETLGRTDRLCPVCMLAMAQDSVSAPVREALRGFWSDAECWVRAVIEDGQRDGQLVASIDARIGAETLIAGLEGAMVSARLFQDRRRMNDAINCLLAMTGCETPGSATRAKSEPRGTRRGQPTSALHRTGGTWS